MKGMGHKGSREKRTPHFPRVTLPLCFHAWLGSFITYPSCKLSHLEHTIYP